MSAARVCGTGGGGGFSPKPGDPDNNIFISASPAFGGVDIGLVYPETNAHAVAFVNLYRSTNSDPATALYHHKMVGSYFFDRNTAATSVTYYYWAEMVTVNGTAMPRKGPASAAPRPMIDVLIEQLTGKIDQGLLANSLKDDVALIQSNKLGLDAETLARAASDDSLAASLAETRAISEDTQALVQQEVLARAAADSALVDSVNTLAVKVGQDIQAAIQQEQQLRAAADQVLATQINTAQAKLGNDIASVQTTMGADIRKIGDELLSIGALYTAKVTANGLIGGFGVYNDGKEVEAAFDVDRFWIGRTNNNRRKPFIIEGSQTFIDTAMIREASIQEGQLGPINVGKLRLQDGTPVTTVAGVIRAEAIDAANLNVGSAARFSGDVSSSNYSPGKAGWLIKQNGYVEFNEAVIRGNLEIKSLTINGESPLGGIVLDTTAYSASRSLTSTGQSFSHTREIVRTFRSVPKGSQITIDTNGAVGVTFTATSGNGYTTRTSGGDGDSVYTFHSMPRSVYCAYEMRFRLWINGAIQEDVRVRASDGEVVTARASGNNQPQTVSRRIEATSKKGFLYVVPSFRETMDVRVLLEIILTNVRHGSQGTYGSASFLASHGNRMGTGVISRLG